MVEWHKYRYANRCLRAFAHSFMDNCEWKWRLCMCAHFHNEIYKTDSGIQLYKSDEKNAYQHLSVFVHTHGARCFMHLDPHMWPFRKAFSRNGHIIVLMYYNPFSFNWSNIVKHILPRDVQWCITLHEHLLITSCAFRTWDA